MNQPLLVTGSKGLVASRFIKDYQNKYTIEPIDISHPTNPVDITDQAKVMQTFQDSDAPAVIHAAAYTNVTGAWRQRDDTSGAAYQVNVEGTKNVAQATAETGKQLIHLSTAYVFDGEKAEPYTEEDQPNPIEWYGYTKLEAEKVIQNVENLSWTILRIDQPFRSDPFAKGDLAHNIINGLQTGSLPPQFTNRYFGPTYLNDFSHILDAIISQQLTGLFHATNGESWTNHDFAQEIKSAHQLQGKVEEGDLDVYLQTTSRPYQRNTALDISKLTNKLELELTPIKQAIAELEF